MPPSDDVAQGQVLARLSATALDLQRAQLTASLASARAQIAQADAQVVEARAAADEAQRVRARTEALQVRGSATQAAAETAAASATAAEARVLIAIEAQTAARAQEALVNAQIANIDLQVARTEIKAPVAGRIVARNAQVGAIASAQAQPMFEIVRDGALELRADVAEPDMQRLAPGQRVTLRAVGLAAPLTGTVRLVEPAIDAASRLGRVRITVDGSDGLRQGMFLEAEILVAERTALAVPVTAVGASAEGATVMRVDDNRVARVPVATGIRDNGWVEIVSGLEPAQQVVAKAAAFVRDGDRITPVPAPAN
ncbi:MAG: efflux RND transporter periplasmic adaptor subunit [Rhodobacterales bacterium]|nr:efflux RND transporter periplasmic adaptor subunit [Rhodobacterales bacterium]